MLQEHWGTIATAVNAKHHYKDPKTFTTCYTATHCEQKLRNLRGKYNAENTRRKKLRADMQQTGRATESLPEVGNDGGWNLYHVFRDAFRLGDPTDEVEQDSGVHVGLVTESAAPGAAAAAAEQEEIIDVPGIAPGQLLSTAGDCCMHNSTSMPCKIMQFSLALESQCMQCHT